jgi:hypothetical protein
MGANSIIFYHTPLFSSISAAWVFVSLARLLDKNNPAASKIQLRILVLSLSAPLGRYHSR